MQFRDAHLDGFSGFLDNFLNGILKSIGVALLSSKSAKLTTQDTIIGVVDVTIENVAGPVTHFALACQIGNSTQCIQVFRFEEAQGFVFGNPFTGGDLVVKVSQLTALDEKLHALAIPEDLPVDKAVRQNTLFGLTKEERRSF